MARAQLDPAVLAHLEWLGFVRPNGLVVSAPALVRAGAILDRRDVDGQRLLRACVTEPMVPRGGTSKPYLADFQAFARSVLGWGFSPKAFAGTGENPLPPDLMVALADYDEVLAPDLAVRELEPREGAACWQLLVSVVDAGADFDEAFRGEGQLEASPHSRMERLLRETRIGAGLLFNGHCLRLLSAPRGESSGWLDFQVADMMQPAGRPICTALRLLLSQRRLLALPRHQRLAALLEDSRKFQNEVSERLAEQVLHALYELLRGFQAAHNASGGNLLRQPLVEHPDEVYHALLAVILRLVFLLYAEERDMLPEEETFLRFYSLGSLHERLREDAALNPDTMDQRYGAWAQLLVLFRMIHDGARAMGMELPVRQGALFDPDRYPFLEGRQTIGVRQIHEGIVAPLVPDGTVHRVLEKLLVLDGERISYRALDVEQIGSVYETMMGFGLNTAAGPTVAVRPRKKQGAPGPVDLGALLEVSPSARAKWVEKAADRPVPDSVKRALPAAGSVGDLHAVLAPLVDVAATPDLVPAGAMVLQPSEERRRSGSHYTPRALTRPIVATALEPVLAALRGEDGAPPRGEQILDLKVCDPAMGSGAFLVEACRQLGEALIAAWRAYGEAPALPPDEDEVVFARRLVAQRCLYGVDRNPVAVDLAKVSLWLITLASEHPLTFLDHALRQGDSLVGLSRRQIEAFHWDPEAPVWQEGFEAMRVGDHLAAVADLRERIRTAAPDVLDVTLRDLWEAAEGEMRNVRLFGDLAVAAFFEADGPRHRDAKRLEFSAAIANATAGRYENHLSELRQADPPMAPFHWEVEFPEVFDRPNPGFDAIVGNPPFAGKNSVGDANVVAYPDWLKCVHEHSHGNADLVAHFFRRAFSLLRRGGVFGLIATNTIAQGDTRASGLRWICTHGGEVFEAQRRYKWPGQAAVVVSVIHVMKGSFVGPRLLDGCKTEQITAFLFDHGGHEDPARLSANAGKSFQGSIVLGMGFTFDDTDTKGVANSLPDMHRLIEKNAANAEVIFPYIGGEEVNTSPMHAHHRYVINFGERAEAECRWCWPDLLAIVEANVKPERELQKDRGAKEKWWQFIRTRPELQAAITGLDRVLVVNCGATPHLSLVFLPPTMVFAHSLTVFALSSPAAFCALQARPHEIWARFFGSSMKDDLRYTPSDCFETFPFPEGWEHQPGLEAAGREYYEFRASLMVRNDEGLTKTYNRFHDPDEFGLDIITLRDLHAAMDRAVLEAYGWSDVPTTCEFLLDYEAQDEEGAARKKPWRYRWPDHVRDEVLARLLMLNAERAKEEARRGAGSKGSGRTRGKQKPAPMTEGLF